MSSSAGTATLARADPRGGLPVHHLTRENHLQGSTQADQTSQPDGPSIAGNDPEPHLGKAESRPLAGNPEMAGEGQLAPTTEGVPADRRDHRLGEALDPTENPLAVTTDLYPGEGVHLGQHPDVRAGDKRLFSRAGQDHTPHVTVSPHGLERSVQLADDVGVEGVELFRSVDGDGGDAVLPLHPYELCVGHGALGMCLRSMMNRGEGMGRETYSEGAGWGQPALMRPGVVAVYTGCPYLSPP